MSRDRLHCLWRLLAHGTTHDVIAGSHLVTFNVTGEGLATVASELEQKPGVDTVAPFGASLHVSGRDRAALEATLAPYRDQAGLIITEIDPSLEDVFIGLMAKARDNFQ